MPRIVKAHPKYRRHKATGQAVVTLYGEEIYLGKFGSSASRREYDRLVSEWLVAGRPARRPRPNAPVHVDEVCSEYHRFAKSYYSDGHARCVKDALAWAVKFYGDVPAVEFGPLSLEALREKMIAAGHSRNYINGNIDKIRRAVRHAVAKELIPPAVVEALRALPGLRKGKSAARETAPVQPVSADVVEATLAKMPKVPGELLRFQLLTGCRPGEARIIRPCDVDANGEVWVYRPAKHKTEHHGKDRQIMIGPKAQEILRPYLLRAHDAYCFTPADSEKKRHAAQREARKTPVQPSQRRRRPKRNPKRKPGDCYGKDALNWAIRRAAKKAGVPAWSANQLRHTAATEIRAKYGLEAVAATLGHAKVETSQIYAEKNMELAAQVAKQVG